MNIYYKEGKSKLKISNAEYIENKAEKVLDKIVKTSHKYKLCSYALL